MKIILELDHQANAVSQGLTLNPTKLLLFGNPKLGTPLMANSQSTGLDLPQKVLVTENGQGIVTVSYNDPLYLKERHAIDDCDEILQKVSGALDNITAQAIIA